jgi:hypothetical protein
MEREISAVPLNESIGARLRQTNRHIETRNRDIGLISTKATASARGDYSRSKKSTIRTSFIYEIMRKIQSEGAISCTLMHCRNRLRANRSLAVHGAGSSLRC